MMRKEKLFKKFIQNKATEDEIRELFRHMGSWDEHELEEEIRRYEQDSPEKPRISQGTVRQFLSIAASIVLVFSASLFIYLRSDQKDVSIPITDVIGISESSAVITFSDGRELNMEEGAAIYIGEGEVSTDYTDYFATLDLSYIDAKFDRITTPIGGQTTFILPDSTKVKLNGDSKLKFARHLVDGKRYVELEGEAFFEVKKREVPFVVQTRQQQVTVLGTSFNVSAYNNAPSSSVALISGKVELALSNDFKPNLTERMFLNPGDVGVVNAGQHELYLADLDTERHVAWMHGRLEFDQESLDNIIRRLQYWYDVEVVFKGDVEKLKFTGSISRTETMQSVLDKLTMTQKIKYEVRERRIEIMKN